jgi:sulfite reductase alpha subunit-like flavoprotein
VPGSSPADLAVAFRSFPRRVHEAVALAKTADERARAATADREVARIVNDAAAVMHTSATGHVSDVAAAVADRISAEKADHWDDTRLDALRNLAAAAGRALRGNEPTD